MAIVAVITGDIVNSTRLAAPRERRLLRALQQVLLPNLYEFYRGDSFQAYQKNPGDALKTALLCRSAAIGITQEEEQDPSDVRISIGIGQAKPGISSLRTAKGEAFTLSGRAFDEIAKSNRRLVIVTENPLANEGLQVLGDYINAIFKGMTGKQAKVIFELLNGETQLAIAEKLKKSTSTISQHVSSGRWPEIEKLLKQYENIINQIS